MGLAAVCVITNSEMDERLNDLVENILEVEIIDFGSAEGYIPR